LKCREQVDTSSIRQDAHFDTLDITNQNIVTALLEDRNIVHDDLVEQFRTFGLSQEGEHAHTRQNTSTQLQDLGAIQQAEHAETRAVVHQDITAQLQDFVRQSRPTMWELAPLSIKT
jgi:hypothetical protein